ncbi:hypothetical protein CLU79DRAFT_736780 [Phycomyces nitens]|nr:hypothetical protein CLU79DRAFT_736780 [Phycomyces nitens]
MVVRKPHISSATARFLSLLFILLILNVHLNLVLGAIPSSDSGIPDKDGTKAAEVIFPEGESELNGYEWRNR